MDLTLGGPFDLSEKSLHNMVSKKFSKVKHGLNLKLPMPLRAAMLDLLELSINRQDDPLIPPLRLRRIIGQTDNYTMNRVTQLKIYCGLKPTDSILDVGCGCGSLAYSLIRYHYFQGKYEGFDIIKEFTDWLRQNITPKYPNFHFKHANVYSASYNYTAKILPSKYKFPHPDNTFDIALVGSVFSHMLPADLENYLSEIARVLKPNGKCLASYFLLTPLRPKELRDDEIRSRFIDSGKGYSTTNMEYPEDAVAYDQKYILSQYKKLGLALVQPVVYGELQDLVVAKKSRNS
jgi:ubiquinone/menaquinone biosynthesis C-methylase UbiE